MYYIGIDIGSASACMALLNEQRELIKQRYLILKGASKENRQLLQEEINAILPQDNVYKIAVSGSGSEILNLPSVNEISALAAGTHYVAPGASSVMEIGGGSAKYVVDLQKEHIQFALNDNCSAGTGSFFAAQMQRLGLPLEEYSAMVAKAKSILHIAGRCSVFAKTDIIHSQQAGKSIEDILLGLCYAVVRNFKASVAGKLVLQKPVFLAGGTALNKGVVAAVKDVFKLEDSELLVLEASPVVTAIGTALLAKDMGKELHANQIESIFEDVTVLKNEKIALPTLRNPHTDLSSLQDTQPFVPNMGYYLGIDIGSTSTNLVLLNKDEEVVHFQYLRTKGNPRGAVQQGFEELTSRFGSDMQIKAVGTTGSGRHHIGQLIGADTVQDEITAQATAAVHFMPEVDTAMEIGGQDSKYIRIENGLVRNFEMNKICAAGTGAFIEEQAAKLDIPIEEYGKIALASRSPAELGDRCTVLIESSINAHLADGVSKEDVAAGLCYSIVSNYLNRVVGDKPVGKHILLLGGVAHNPAIVAAFKDRFGKRIEVGRYFNVNGAVGAALLAKNSISEAKTTFKGVSCLIGNAEKEADAIPFKAADTDSAKVSKPQMFEHSNYKDPNKKTIGMPRALYIYNIFPVVNSFFQQLGYNVILSDESSEEIVERAQSHARTEVCYPLKLAMGHVAQLLETGINYLFMPSVISLDEHSSQSGANCACVYMQSVPSMLAETVDLQAQNVTLLDPVLDLSSGRENILSALYQTGIQLGHTEAECRRAIEQGGASRPGQRGAHGSERGEHERVAHRGDKYSVHALYKGGAQPGNMHGRGAFSPGFDLKNSDKPVFVVITRGYCAKDSILNLNIENMLAERGYQFLVPKQLLGILETPDSELQQNFYWSFASRTLLTAKAVAATPNLYAVYLTYHGCGPDTMVSHWVENEMMDKPYLHIEVDEHSSNVGTITRLDAFINSVLSHRKKEDGATKLAVASVESMNRFSEDIQTLNQGYPVVLPYMYPYSQLLAAHLDGKGFQVLELPPTSPESLKKSRSYMRGKECFSLSALLGNVALEAEEHSELQLLYPQNSGAEADGLYAYFVYRKLADKLSVISPNLDKLALYESDADAVFRILLAGDIALAAGNDALLSEMQEAFRSGIPDEDALARWAGTCRDSGDFLLVLGEPGCIFDALFQKTILGRMRSSNVLLRFAPLSEMLLLEWGKVDGFTAFNAMKQLIARVADAMGQCSVFSEPVEMLRKENSDFYICRGGYAEYRHCKVDFTHPQLRGIISAASQHENTESILELASHQSKNPMLGIRFDGTDDPVNRLKIDTFLHVVKRNMN